jgi:ATP-dependent Clp protease ATP-binding subunit ClpC
MKALELSHNEAFMLGHNHISPEHILLGLLRLGEGVAAQVFPRHDVSLEQTRQRVIRTLSGHPPGTSPAA